MKKKSFANRKLLLIFGLLGIFFSFFQPTCGAFTRVSNSGDGCPDWPTCFGSWLPPFNDINAIIEWSHRTSGTLFGLVSIVLVIISYLVYKKLNFTVKIYLIALILIIVVGGIGGAVVLSELDPAIRTVHLAGAQIIAALMVIAFLNENKIQVNNVSKKIYILALVTSILAITSLLSGAYAVWQGAGAVCYRWPLCDDYLIPRYTNQWIHMTHRVISLGLIVHVIRLSIMIIKSHSGSIFSKMGYLLIFSGIIQTVIGGSIPLSGFSIWSRTLHLGLATIVWMISVSIIIVIKTKKSETLKQ